MSSRRWQGEKPATGLQAAAREARYALLADAAEEMGAQCIVTAHTADDQAETVTMRQSRSQADAPGLAGMADGVLVDRRVWVLRPFLGLRRADIRDYLSAGRGLVRRSEQRQSALRAGARAAGARMTTSVGHRSIQPRRREAPPSSARVASLLERHVTVFNGLPRGSIQCSPRRSPIADCRRAILSPRRGALAAGGICRAGKRPRGLPRFCRAAGRPDDRRAGGFRSPSFGSLSLPRGQKSARYWSYSLVRKRSGTAASSSRISVQSR